MVTENPALYRNRRREDVLDKERAPFIRPSDEVWNFCVEMGEKYGMTPRDAYCVLEQKIVHIVKLHEDKNARVTVSTGGTSVEVNFFKDHKETLVPKTP